MLKLIGCFGILVGAEGLFLEWKRQEKKRVLQLQELEHFLQKGEFAIEKECKPSRIFFGEYIDWDVKSPVLKKVLQELEEKLERTVESRGRGMAGDPFHGRGLFWKGSKRNGFSDEGL